MGGRVIGLSVVLFLALVIGVGFAMKSSNVPPVDHGAPWVFLDKNPPGGCSHGAYLDADERECRWDPINSRMGTRIHPNSMAAEAGWLVWPQDAICSVCGHVDLHWHKQAEERRKAKEKEEADKKEQERLKEQRKRQEFEERMDRRAKFRAAIDESVARQEKVNE